jgi:hypothetical protein
MYVGMGRIYIYNIASKAQYSVLGIKKYFDLIPVSKGNRGNKKRNTLCFKTPVLKKWS